MSKNETDLKENRESLFHSEYQELSPTPKRDPIALLATYFFCHETNRVRLQVDKVRKLHDHHEFIACVENTVLEINELRENVREKLRSLFH